MTSEEFAFSPLRFMNKLSVSIPDTTFEQAVKIVDSPHYEPTFTDLLGDHQNKNDDLLFDLSPYVSPVAMKNCKQFPTTTVASNKKIVLDHQLPPVKETSSDNNGRLWKTVASKLDLAELSIKLKTRRDAPSEVVPDKLYSSLKYEVHLTASGKSIQQLPFLLARAAVVDSQTLEKVQLSNNAAVLKGDIEASMSKVPSGPQDLVKGMLKIQLNSELSYHHEKRLLCLVVEFFEPDCLDSPVVIARSACVKCYARKPNKKYPKKKQASASTVAAENKKRKKPTEDDLLPQESPPKKLKETASASTAAVAQPQIVVEDDFQNFKTRLDDLMEINSTHSEHVRFMCLNYLLQKILTSDPLAAKMLMPHVVNPFASVFQQHAYFVPQPSAPAQIPIVNENVADDVVDSFEADLLQFADEFLN